MPTCQCPRKWKGEHYTTCRFYRKFHIKLGTGKVNGPLSDSEDELSTLNLPSLGRPQHQHVETLCCCLVDETHTESHKFMLIKREEPIIDQQMIKEMGWSQAEGDAHLQKLLAQYEEGLERDEKALHRRLFPKGDSHNNDFEERGKSSVKVKDNLDDLIDIPKTN